MTALLAKVFNPNDVPTSPGWLLFYFLCALFLICVPYIIWYIRERYWAEVHEKMEEEFQKKMALEKKFTDKVVATDQETDALRLEFKLCRGNFISEVYNELHEDLTIIFGEDYKKKFPLPGSVPRGCDEYCPSHNMYWAIYLLQAHKGKVGWFAGDSLLGFQTGQGDEIEWQIKILKRVEYYLMKFHPEEGDNVKLYQMPTVKDRDGNWLRVLEIIDPDGKNGSFCCSEVGLGYWWKEKGRRMW